MWPIPKSTIIIVILYNQKHVLYTKTKVIPLHLLPHVYKYNGYEQNIYTKKVMGIPTCLPFTKLIKKIISCNDPTLYIKLRSLLKRNNDKRHFF